MVQAEAGEGFIEARSSWQNLGPERKYSEFGLVWLKKAIQTVSFDCSPAPC